ncbi:MAG: peroxiredoxin [Ignavibacteria bacterium]|nr:peroxiredoxin [Ignavibacteria bacterium]
MKIIFSIIILGFFSNILNAFSLGSDSLKANQEAPDFTLEDAFGNKYQLSSYRDKTPVVVYFYPKASTPGCTKQACSIRDEWSKFEENNIQVLGISVDSKEEIGKFIELYSLNFPLLSDSDKSVSKAYGVLNKFGVSSRVTFIINKNGVIAEVIDKVNVTTHASDVFDIALKLK